MPGDDDGTPTPPRALAAEQNAGTRVRARSITAAAKRIDLSNPRDRGAIPRNSAEWQRAAWDFYDLLPEVKFAGRFLGSALSRLLLYPGLRVQPDEPPAALRDVLTMQEAELVTAAKEDRAPDPLRVPFPGLNDAMVTAAEEDLAALANRRTGQAGLLRSWGVCLTIPGDSWLVGTAEMDTDAEGRPQATGEDEWQVLSDQNLSREGNRVKVRLAPGAQQEVLPEEATIIRVWRPHEAWPALADSNMRAALDVCDELLIYARQFRSVGKSRNNAGVLLLPTELDFAAQVPMDEETGLPIEPVNPNALGPLELGVVKSMITPVEDDGSASAVVPHFLRGPSEHLQHVRHIPLDRKIDDQAIGRLNFLLTRLAHGLDVPVEVLLGLADVNHWTAWQIEDSTYRAHVEPLASLPAYAITTAYLRPNLREHPAWNTAEGLAILDRLEVGVDPSLLVARPNRAQDAKDAHKALVISDGSLRKYLGLSDADAPSDEELLRRYALERGIGAQAITREVMRGTIDGADDIVADPAEAIADEVEAEQGAMPDADAPQDQPTPDDERPDDATAAVTAALGPIAARVLPACTPIDRMAMVAAAHGNIGQRLAAIDQRLRARLQEAASAAVEDALRVAGNRLRAKAANVTALRAATKGHNAVHVGPILAAAGALSTEDEDQALEGAFAGLGVRWDDMVSQAQDDTEAVLRSASTAEGAGLDQAMDDYRSTTEEDRRAGWQVLHGLLATLARGRLRGLEEDLSDGEFDTTTAVQAGPVREALARAGGSVEPTRPPVQVAGHLEPGASGGVATGPRSLGTLVRLGLATVGWEWLTGAPSHSFPPHSRLAGTRFTSWDDPALASGGWPGHGSYFPGDHRGCQCDAVPVVVEVGRRDPQPA